MRTLFFRPISFWILISILFLGVRFFNLPNSINFGTDAARDFLVALNIYTTKHPVLIGPPSEYAFNGRQFFFGPAPYYIILPALIVGNWNPLAVSYFLIILNFVVLLASIRIIITHIKEKPISYCFALFCAITPAFIQESQSYWNPYFMLPTSILLVSLMIKNTIQKNNTFLSFILIGFLFGLGMQFHYSFIFAVMISVIWLFVKKKINIKSITFLLGGFVIGFFPLIFFELRNNFYNLNTILLVLTHPSKQGSEFTLNTFYLISLFPFFFYFLSVILVKTNTISRFIIYLFFIGYILWSLSVILTPTMSLLSYPDLKLISKKIEKDNPKNFNIVDQLTEDNRAIPLRYLLTIDGYKPQGVTDYSNIQTLYIYSERPLNVLLKTPVYEIKSFLPFKEIKIESTVDNIFLYELHK
jgi:hypothetical protein